MCVWYNLSKLYVYKKYWGRDNDIMGGSKAKEKKNKKRVILRIIKKCPGNTP